MLHNVAMAKEDINTNVSIPIGNFACGTQPKFVFFFFFFFFFFLVLYSSKNGESQEVKEMFCRRDTKNQKRFALETKYTQQN